MHCLSLLAVPEAAVRLRQLRLQPHTAPSWKSARSCEERVLPGRRCRWCCCMISTHMGHQASSCVEGHACGDPTAVPDSRVTRFACLCRSPTCNPGLDSESRDMVLHLVQPAWLIGCLIHRLGRTQHRAVLLQGLLGCSGRLKVPPASRTTPSWWLIPCWCALRACNLKFKNTL